MTMAPDSCSFSISPAESLREFRPQGLEIEKLVGAPVRPAAKLDGGTPPGAGGQGGGIRGGFALTAGLIGYLWDRQRNGKINPIGVR